MNTKNKIVLIAKGKKNEKKKTVVNNNNNDNRYVILFEGGTRETSMYLESPLSSVLNSRILNVFQTVNHITTYTV